MRLTRRPEFDLIHPFCNQAIRCYWGPLLSIARNAGDDSRRDEVARERANCVVSRDSGTRDPKRRKVPKDPFEPRSDPVLGRTFSRSTMTSTFSAPTERAVMLNVRRSLHPETFQFPAKPFLLAHYSASILFAAGSGNTHDAALWINIRAPADESHRAIPKKRRTWLRR